MKKLYYTLENWEDNFGQGITITLYDIRNNRPIRLTEIETDPYEFSSIEHTLRDYIYDNELQEEEEDEEEYQEYEFIKL